MKCTQTCAAQATFKRLTNGYNLISILEQSRPDMKIKVATFTVPHKSYNI